MVWNKIKGITNFLEVHFVIVYPHLLRNHDGLSSFIIFNVNCCDAHSKCHLVFKIINQLGKKTE